MGVHVGAYKYTNRPKNDFYTEFQSPFSIWHPKRVPARLGLLDPPLVISRARNGKFHEL